MSSSEAPLISARISLTGVIIPILRLLQIFCRFFRCKGVGGGGLGEVDAAKTLLEEVALLRLIEREHLACFWVSADITYLLNPLREALGDREECKRLVERDGIR